MASFNAPKSPQQKQAATPAVCHAFPGDEVYFHKAGTPVSGKVVAVGQHGCTVEHGGGHHRVKWEHIAGHKKRAVQRYRVLEEGADGMIVADNTGNRRFVGIPPEARGERLVLDKPKPKASLTKSFHSPGLSLMPAATRVDLHGLSDLAKSLDGMVVAVHQTAASVAANGAQDASAIIARLDGLASLQSQLVAAIQALVQAQPVINFEPKIDIMVPDQLAPVVNLTVPEQAAPVVHVNVPQQAAPVVNIEPVVIPAPVVNVEAPVVHVAAPAVTIEPVVVPAPVVHVAAPVVNIEPVVVPAPNVTLELPEPRRVVTEIERDKDGNITRAVQKQA
jgi:hypothetical protein